MTALVVDDEELAREEMKRLLQENGQFSEIYLAENERQALQICDRHTVETVFLDIEMPGTDGFHILKALDQEIPVVFTTAHSEHAVRAFEAGVVDYLVKPIDPDRLKIAVERVLDAQAGKVQTESSPLRSDDRIFLRDGERVWLVTIKDIEVLEACGNYTKLYFSGGPALIRRPLKDFLARFEGHDFFRINRERAVSLGKIGSVESSPRGHLCIKMQSGESYEMSRHQSVEFQRRMAF